MRDVQTKKSLLRLVLNKDLEAPGSRLTASSISLNHNKKGGYMPTDKNTPVLNNTPSQIEEKVKDTRTPISLENSIPVIENMGKEEFDKHFRITGINALSVYIKQNPDSPIARCYQELGKTNQVHFKIGDEKWVIRINGARVKK